MQQYMQTQLVEYSHTHSCKFIASFQKNKTFFVVIYIHESLTLNQIITWTRLENEQPLGNPIVFARERN